MTLTRCIFFILLPLLLVSCRKEEVPRFRTDKLDGEKAILIGEWQWIYTNYVYDLCDAPGLEVYEILTPITESRTYQITFDEEGYVNFNNLDTKRIVFLFWQKDFDNFTPNMEYEFGIFLNGIQEYGLSGEVANDTLKLGGSYVNEPYEQISCQGCCSYTNYFVKI